MKYRSGAMTECHLFVRISGLRDQDHTPVKRYANKKVLAVI